MMPVGSIDRPRRGVARRSSADKRRTIMWAALRLFIGTGYERTRIGDICEASGFSVGSIYHFFGSKADIAAELCAHGARSWSEAVAAPLRDAASAEAAVRGYVRAFHTWVRANPELYNFINDHRVEAASSAAMAGIARAQRTLEESMVARLAQEAATGSVRALETPVYRALIDGPCTCHLLWWARNRGDIDEAALAVEDAVWRAVRPAAAADTPDPPVSVPAPASGRVDAALVERMRRAGARGAETRERILAVAMDCFAEVGFEGASVLDIARRADIAVGTIYHHFGSKEGIAAAWCAEAWNDWYRTMRRSLEVERRADEKIRGMVHAIFDWVRVNADLYTFIYDLRRIATARPRVEAYEAARSDVVRALAAELAAPIARGELRAMSAQATMFVVSGMCLGYLVPWSARRDDWGDAPAVVAEATWRAVRADPPSLGARGETAPHVAGALG